MNFFKIKYNIFFRLLKMSFIKQQYDYSQTFNYKQTEQTAYRVFPFYGIYV